MRADRLISLVLLLQARGRMTASALAVELEVSVRSIYRDLNALSRAGVPVLAQGGPGGGCRLLDGYRFPLSSLGPEEAESLLLLGVPKELFEIGLGEGVLAAQSRVRVAAGMGEPPAAVVHFDLPRWFQGGEQVPHLRSLARAVRTRRRVVLDYQAPNQGTASSSTVDPLGVVNKAGTWYLVALAGRLGPRVYRVSRIQAARLLTERSSRPAAFDLRAFWESWSEEFSSSRPQIAVQLRASPTSLRCLSRSLRRGSGRCYAPGWRTRRVRLEDRDTAVRTRTGGSDPAGGLWRRDRGASAPGSRRPAFAGGASYFGKVSGPHCLSSRRPLTDELGSPRAVRAQFAQPRSRSGALSPSDSPSVSKSCLGYGSEPVENRGHLRFSPRKQ
ncbi:MAG: helix-turn-helix transcriptional regulator [Candidatus Dormibacteria bacterium]